LDVKKRFSEEQIIGFLREAEAGPPAKDLCRKHGFSGASYYLWRSKFGGMSVPEARRLKELETENGRLKKLLAGQVLENEVIKDACEKSGNRTGPSRAGAAPDGSGPKRAALAGRHAHERQRQRLALCATPGPQYRAA
jgi:putative transposase